MKPQSPDEFINGMKRTQAIWDELKAEAKRQTKRSREPLVVAGYAAGEEPWALFLLPPEPQGDRALPPRLLFIQKVGSIIAASWVEG